MDSGLRMEVPTEAKTAAEVLAKLHPWLLDHVYLEAGEELYVKMKATYNWRGITESLRLIATAPGAHGWLIGQVPLGSSVLSYGDLVQVIPGKNFTPAVARVILASKWRTVCARSTVPPPTEVVKAIDQRGWLGAWNKDGLLSIAVPAEDLTEARSLQEEWEALDLLSPRD